MQISILATLLYLSLPLLSSSFTQFFHRKPTAQRLNPSVLSFTSSSDLKSAPLHAETLTSSKTFVVVGGGWGGWGACQRLCEFYNDTAKVILLDSLIDPTGSTPYLSKTGKPVEAGTRGFWKDYPNINFLVEQTLNLDPNEVWTDFTNSSFYSPDGLEATAPVFSNAKFQLPSPLGQVLATFPLFERLPLSDRTSMVGLLLATVDCIGSEDESVKAGYDKMNAHDLFVKFGLSKRLVEDFITPTLLVGLFKPPEELSALVVMELLYYYALAHQDSFDVRWIKKGTVATSIIAPMAKWLEEEYCLEVKGGCRVTKVNLKGKEEGGGVDSICYLENGNDHTIDNIDGVVFALGNNGLKNVVNGSPDLAKIPSLAGAASLNGIDVISTRIWFDKTVKTRTPANVFAKFKQLRGAGGTFFMLDQLQEGGEEDLWGGEEVQGSVVACDFYNSGAFMGVDDDEIIRTLTEDLLPAAVPEFGTAKVVDSWVGKYKGAVSWFSPGSYTKRPSMFGDKAVPKVKFAGDVVRMGEREHGAKGLCQERAYVAGLQAADEIVKEVGEGGGGGAGGKKMEGVLQVREDEVQFTVGSQINNRVNKLLGPLARPWVRN
ncbi:hypothetical protein TL16_g09851 [Triparma laevis f. inornata]|uniref:Amine oxidase domain-containing protein n=2 Tax=Triparma laevis TaxID=1534972 RepID=A0A9W7C206_9STRA|nr:hypothetical protein TL16_g09851 [Triparma laevis f. inornata]GMI01265.1 hypothetical protein TrLO_g9532 [Triparma laevis f. longispina]